MRADKASPFQTSLQNKQFMLAGAMLMLTRERIPMFRKEVGVRLPVLSPG